MEYGELDAVSPDDKWRHDVEDYAATLRAMANFIESCPEIARDKALWEDAGPCRGSPRSLGQRAGSVQGVDLQRARSDHARARPCNLLKGSL